jgi:hypothetical protein
MFSSSSWSQEHSLLENRRPRNAFLGAQEGESHKGGDRTMRLTKEKPEFKFSNHLDKKSIHRTLLVSGAIQKRRRHEMHYPDMVTLVPIVGFELSQWWLRRVLRPMNGLHGVTSQTTEPLGSYCTLKIWSSNILMSRSQWPRALRHELSSLARPLGSWVRIPLKAWMSVCAFILCLCSLCR